MSISCRHGFHGNPAGSLAELDEDWSVGDAGRRGLVSRYPDRRPLANGEGPAPRGEKESIHALVTRSHASNTCSHLRQSKVVRLRCQTSCCSGRYYLCLRSGPMFDNRLESRARNNVTRRRAARLLHVLCCQGGCGVGPASPLGVLLSLLMNVGETVLWRFHRDGRRSHTTRKGYLAPHCPPPTLPGVSLTPLLHPGSTPRDQ